MTFHFLSMCTTAHLRNWLDFLAHSKSKIDLVHWYWNRDQVGMPLPSLWFLNISSQQGTTYSPLLFFTSTRERQRWWPATIHKKGNKQLSLLVYSVPAHPHQAEMRNKQMDPVTERWDLSISPSFSLYLPLSSHIPLFRSLSHAFVATEVVSGSSGGKMFLE